MSNSTSLQLVPRLSGSTGERIQSARKFQRLSQTELLDVMRRIDPDTTPSSLKTFSGWENDHKSPTVAEIRLVAHATGFPVEDFVAEEATNDPRDPAEQVSQSFPCRFDDLAARRARRTLPDLLDLPTPARAA